MKHRKSGNDSNGYIIESDSEGENNEERARALRPRIEDENEPEDAAMVIAGSPGSPPRALFTQLPENSPPRLALPAQHRWRQPLSHLPFRMQSPPRPGLPRFDSSDSENSDNEAHSKHKSSHDAKRHKQPRPALAMLSNNKQDVAMEAGDGFSKLPDFSTLKLGAASKEASARGSARNHTLWKRPAHLSPSRKPPSARSTLTHESGSADRGAIPDTALKPKTW